MESPKTRPVHNFLGRLDVERPNSDRDLSQTPRAEKNRLIAHNLYHATFEGMNAIPGISLVTGIATVVAGAVELFAGFFNWEEPEGKAQTRGAVKMIVLGAAAAALPGVGNLLNGVFAVSDTIDTINSAT